MTVQQVSLRVDHRTRTDISYETSKFLSFLRSRATQPRRIANSSTSKRKDTEEVGPTNLNLVSSIMPRPEADTKLYFRSEKI